MVDNKILLNNQIVARRKTIQKAKTAVINKHVNKIRNTKRLIEKYPENTKFKKKLEKSTEILFCLKKLKCQHILKEGILYEKDPQKVLTSGNSTAEEFALATVISNKLVKNTVKELKELFNLDLDASLKESLNQPSRKQKKKKILGKKTKVKAVRKIIKDPAINKWQVTDVGEQSTTGATENKFKVPNEKRFIEIKAEPEINNEGGSENKKKIRKSDESNSVPVSKTLDSFFITQSGDNYLSTAVPVVNLENPRVSVKHEHPNKPMRENFNAGGDYKHKSQSFSNNFKGKKPNSVPPFRGTKQHFGNDFQNRPKFERPQKTETPEDLHPSWLAKQRLKPTITQFQGKKMIFGDDDEQSSSKSTKKVFSPFNDKKSTSNAKLAEGSEDLHPSWAAKQKLKPIISEFKGKKITFDD